VHYNDIPVENMTSDGARGVGLRLLIGEGDGAPNFAMRLISFDAGGRSPHHSHDYEHETFIVSGSGAVEIDGELIKLEKGDAVYVPANAVHHFEADDGMEMICVIPNV
jgi:quercetin dioxygenase-like cupin family protein